MQRSGHENQSLVLVRHFFYFFGEICCYKFYCENIFFSAKNSVSLVEKILKNFCGFLKFKQITFLVDIIKNFPGFKKYLKHFINRRFFQRKYLRSEERRVGKE